MFTGKQAHVNGRRTPQGNVLPSPRGDKALTVEIEDEEAAIGKVAVKLEQDLIGGTVRRLQCCVSTENS